MLIKGKSSWLHMLLTINGSSFQESWPRIVAATVIATIVTVIELHTGLKEEFTLTPIPFTILGVAIGIFLGFRNNIAYNRFWEGRILWGGLVNTSRSFSRQVLTLLAPAPDGPYIEPAEIEQHQRLLVRMMIAYAHALRHHLRNTDPTPELTAYLTPAHPARLSGQKNVPMTIAQLMAEQLHVLWQGQLLLPFHLPVIEGSLTELLNIQGACERIKSTPFPMPYVLLSHRVVAFFCFLLPFGLVDSIGAFTPLVVFVVSHAFFGLDVIGEEIEEPFGTEKHNLPLHSISRNIEINLLQLLGESKLPAPIQPRRNILL
jgi:putative membrane protein